MDQLATNFENLLNTSKSNLKNNLLIYVNNQSKTLKGTLICDIHTLVVEYMKEITDDTRQSTFIKDLTDKIAEPLQKLIVDHLVSEVTKAFADMCKILSKDFKMSVPGITIVGNGYVDVAVKDLANMLIVELAKRLIKSGLIRAGFVIGEEVVGEAAALCIPVIGEVICFVGVGIIIGQLWDEYIWAYSDVQEKYPEQLRQTIAANEKVQEMIEQTVQILDKTREYIH
jgi:hypothetical protein